MRLLDDEERVTLVGAVIREVLAPPDPEGGVTTAIHIAGDSRQGRRSARQRTEWERISKAVFFALHLLSGGVGRVRVRRTRVGVLPTSERLLADRAKRWDNTKPCCREAILERSGESLPGCLTWWEESKLAGWTDARRVKEVARRADSPSKAPAKRRACSWWSVWGVTGCPR